MTSRSSPRRVELADVATDLGQLAVAADAIASLVYGEGFPPVAGAVVGRGVRVDDGRVRGSDPEVGSVEVGVRARRASSDIPPPAGTVASRPAETV